MDVFKAYTVDFLPNTTNVTINDIYDNNAYVIDDETLKLTLRKHTQVSENEGKNNEELILKDHLRITSNGIELIK